jgi:methionyl aminopeptidase
MIILKSDRELKYLYDAGQVVAKTHKEVAKAVKPGITTLELDKVAEEYILKCQAKPAFRDIMVSLPAYAHPSMKKSFMGFRV